MSVLIWEWHFVVTPGAKGSTGSDQQGETFVGLQVGCLGLGSSALSPYLCPQGLICFLSEF